MLCYYVTLSVLLVFSVLGSNSNEEVIPMDINYKRNGTIAASGELHFKVEDPRVSSGYAVVYSFTLRYAATAVGVKLGKVTYHCDDKTFQSPLENYIPLQRFSSNHNCPGGIMYIDLKNEFTSAVEYNVIAASSDYPTYYLEDNALVSGVIPGHSKDELVTYGAYIAGTSHSGGNVDVVNVTIYSDIFSASTIRAYISQYSSAQEVHPLNLVRVGNVLFASISRSHSLFCMACTRYIHIRTDKVGDEAVFFSVDFHVDRGIKELQMNEEFKSSVMPDIHEAQAVIDFRKLEFDSEWYIQVQKLGQESIPLYLDISRTSFDDGDWDIERTVPLTNLELQTITLTPTDPLFQVGGVYYLRVRSDWSVEDECDFMLVFHITAVTANYLYNGAMRSHASKNTGVSIAYYKMIIPEETFQDYRSLTLRMSFIQYTWNPSPVYCYGFDLFLGEAKTRMIINPQDETSYSLKASVSSRTTYEVTLTENEMGWCTNCLFGIAMRTTNMTSWLVEARLNYVPNLLPPNVVRTGYLVPFAGGVHSYFYLHQSEYRPITISANRTDNSSPHIQLFVAVTGYANMTNHAWTDTTIGDNVASVTIEKGHPSFCTDCSYYIGVYFVGEEVEDSQMEISIQVACSDGVCKSCATGLDPATDCQECLPGYYGDDCQECPSCGHGSCDSGKRGSGKCVCDEGWGPDGQCVTCKGGYWGVQCEACPSCHGHGTCNDGMEGDGQCVCEGNWDPRVDCEDCKSGFWGHGCEGECPKNEEGVICSGHGTCNDKDYGTGRCTCNKGMVGIKCDTKEEEDRCSPSCNREHGACDEEQAVCVCYDGYKGKTCSKGPHNAWAIVAIVVLILLLICIIYYIIQSVRNTTPRKRKDALLQDV